MKRFLLLVLALLLCLFMNTLFVSAREVTTIWNTTITIHSDVPDTEKYILDEEANKDKLYCKTKTDAEWNVIKTDWYNFCTSEFVKSEEADTCTKEFRYPEYECEFAKGSNADKLYCRTVKDNEGVVVETRWFNFCSSELTKTEEGDTCTKEFKNPTYKCYKHEIEEEETPEEEEIVEEEEEIVEEEEPVEIPPQETEIPSEMPKVAVKMDYTKIGTLVALLVVIAVAVIMFLKMKKKKGGKEEVKEEKESKKKK